VFFNVFHVDVQSNIVHDFIGIKYIIVNLLLLCSHIQGGARNVIPLIVHITHFYYYKSI